MNSRQNDLILLRTDRKVFKMLEHLPYSVAYGNICVFDRPGDSIRFQMQETPTDKAKMDSEVRDH